MKLTFLGTGTSYGVPYIACDCAVCTSPDPHNKRLRCSVLVDDDTTEMPIRLLVDTTPDLRQQFLRHGVNQISAVLWTHLHNDHIIGMDDIRAISDRQGYIDGYAGEETLERLRQVFGYVFQEERQRGFPRMTPHLVKEWDKLEFGSLKITAIPIQHHYRRIFAYRFDGPMGSLVYATDCSAIPDESWDALSGADVLVLGALRHRPHVAHFTVEEAVEAAARLGAGRTLFTHIAHDLDHAETNANLPKGVELAYDGLEVCV